MSEGLFAGECIGLPFSSATRFVARHKTGMVDAVYFSIIVDGMAQIRAYLRRDGLYGDLGTTDRLCEAASPVMASMLLERLGETQIASEPPTVAQVQVQVL